MSKAKILPSARYLHARFHYNQQTGTLTRKRTRAIAGFLQKNYWYVYLDGHQRSASRIIWKLVTGREPRGTVDHINGNKLDNRWSNLREATPSQQNANSPLRRNNTSGSRGVTTNRKKWRVRIMINGIRTSVGSFPTYDKAVAAYKAVARQAFGEFCR